MERMVYIPTMVWEVSKEGKCGNGHMDKHNYAITELGQSEVGLKRPLVARDCVACA